MSALFYMVSLLTENPQSHIYLRVYICILDSIPILWDLPDFVKRNPVTKDLFAASEMVKVHIVFEVRVDQESLIHQWINRVFQEIKVVILFTDIHQNGQ